MATRKTTFEVVKLDDIAPLLRNAKILGNAKGADRETASPRILSITYDPSLAVTREMLFTSVGFQVSTVLTIEQATQLCATESFDLIVVGHSIPIAQRQVLLNEVRRRCGTPVLALYRRGELPLTGADYAFDSMESPSLLLETVVNILAPKNGTGRGDKPAN